MTFDRARIKGIAKAILKRSHWTVVLVVAIVGLLGGYIAGEFSGSVNLNFNLGNDYTVEDTDPDMWGYDTDVPDADGGGMYDPWEEDPWEENPWEENYGTDEYDPSWEELWADITASFAELAPFFAVLGIILLIVILLAFAWSIFMGNVMTVGGHGWLLRYWRGETPSIGDAFAAFRIYKPSVWTMFVKNVYTSLWSLLFVIPGIVKGYAYSMVPYIIYENPNLSANQAIKMSQKMTDGYKWDLFVFNLSYFGWQLLSAITGGLVGLLYVNPYMGVAHAGVYEDLKWKAIQSGRLTWENFGQQPPDPAAPYSPYPPYGQFYGYTSPAGQYPPPAGQYYAPPAGQYAPPAGQYPPPAGQYAPPAGQYAPPAGQYAPPAGQYAPPAGQYAPPTSQYAPPAGQYPPPAGQYAPPAGQYVPPAGQYAPPAGQYVPPAGQYAPPAGQYAPPAGQYAPADSPCTPPVAQEDDTPPSQE